MTNFYYDPVKQGYEATTFKTLSGSPAISGSALRLTASAALHLGDIYKCDLIVHAIIPTVPTAGDDRFIGFSDVTMGAELGFEIAGEVLSAVAKDTAGNTTAIIIPFQPEWEDVSTAYSIAWRGPQAIFSVNGQRVAKLTDIAVPKTPMSVVIDNQNADNFDVIGIEFKNIETYSVPLSVTVTPQSTIYSKIKI